MKPKIDDRITNDAKTKEKEIKKKNEKSSINSYSIKNWNKEDRPREKLLLKGPDSLSITELIAILFRTGTAKTSAVDLARFLLSNVNDNLYELSKLSIKNLIKIKGIGLTKAITLVAALELGKRIVACDVVEQNKITSSQDVYKYFHPILSGLRHEEFWVLAMNNSNVIIDKFKVSQGGLSKTIIDIRIIMKKVLENLAVSIILCHNHPSGNITPSDADIDITSKIVKASQLLDIKVLDHIIFSDKKYFSFADEGLL